VKIVGNPVREAFYNADKKTSRKKLKIKDNEFLIASIGGSGGSGKLNEAIIALMKNYSLKEKDVRHIHASGKRYYEKIKAQEPELCHGKGGCNIYEFINDMPTLLSAADVVISRCGAMTIAELSAVGAPSILIPSPNVTGDHQHKNAKLIEEGGGCLP
jgi:UDP-N-acetylglucosamine--N-acetylmuramyl-(pentapeptide) pyrophosphoryl-undecaprenol N-acetylglucosamine transferase